MDNLKKRLNKKGFTLVELLVVIAIIAILSVTAYVALGGQTGKARNSRRMQDIGAMQNALEIYFVENYSNYPDAVDKLVAKKYMPKLPTDPIPDSNGKPINYVYAVKDKTYQIAATLENEDGTYKAYVVGNGKNLINGFNCPTVTDGDTCLPYKL